jgi:small-conductance mechanosensitive channel
MYHRVLVKFKEHNIEIPFPQRDLHVKGTVRVETDRPDPSLPT